MTHILPDTAGSLESCFVSFKYKYPLNRGYAIRRKNMYFKKAKILLGVLVAGIFLLTGCATKDERAAEEAVKQELEKLQSCDSQLIQETIDTQELLPSSQYTEETAEEIGDIFSLFYRDFSFEIKKITVDEDEDTGRAAAKLTAIDARSLAKDYSLSLLKKQVELEAVPEEVEFSLRDSCLMLKELLEEKNYGVKTSEAELSLKKEGDSWKVVHTPELDRTLTGNFASYMADPRLLSPSEIVAAHFDTIKGFDSEQLNIYLSLDHLIDTVDSYSHSLALAIGEQIGKSFGYEITGEEKDDSAAQVEASITGPDFESILADYKKQLTQWLKTSESLSQGASGRREKERELLLSCIKENEATVSKNITINLYNDGINWKIQMDSDIAGAVFGDIPSAIDSVSQDID